MLGAKYKGGLSFPQLAKSEMIFGVIFGVPSEFLAWLEHEANIRKVIAAMSTCNKNVVDRYSRKKIQRYKHCTCGM